MVGIQIGLLAAIAGLLLLMLLRLRRIPLDLAHLDREGRLDRLEKLDRLVKLDHLDRLEKLDHLERLEALERLDDLEKLAHLEVLAEFPERLDRLERQLEGLRPSPEDPPKVSVQVEIADDLREAVRSAVREMERDLKKILRVTGRTRAERVGSLISRRLLDEGYRSVRITGGLPRTRSGRSRIQIPVDAERDGLRYRGVVIMRGNEIEETRLGPEHRMFP